MYIYSFYLSGGVYARTVADSMDEAIGNMAREYPCRTVLVTLAVAAAMQAGVVRR